jgi:hypothetical protein
VRVWYPWHALHDQDVPLCGSQVTAGEHCYVVTLPDGSKTILPVWMTEPESASAAVHAGKPHVSVRALESLRALLDLLSDPEQGGGRR